jgi:hypothetical protein
MANYIPTDDSFIRRLSPNNKNVRNLKLEIGAGVHKIERAPNSVVRRPCSIAQQDIRQVGKVVEVVNNNNQNFLVRHCRSHSVEELFSFHFISDFFLRK